MKKFLCLAVLLMIFLAGSVLASDVAYVVQNSADSFVTAELTALGLTYDVIYESDVLTANFSEYGMILAGDDNFNSPEDIPVNEHKSLILNHYNFYRKGTLGYNYQWGWSWRRGSQSSPSNLEIDDFDISITNGIPKFFQAYTVSDIDTKTYYLSSRKATGIRMLGSIDGVSHTSADAFLAVVYPGTTMLNGGDPIEERNLFFGIVYPEYWTPNSRQLFENSINWVLYGEDNDGDGFYTDDDCDDSNETINPDADETPYDGIDQDCDGFDLIDVDGDGYDSDCDFVTGDCFVIGGLDCNDNNDTINPDNPDPYFNCMNDAPIINLVTMSVNYQEGDLVEITVDATDPEEDAIFYSINDTKFSQVNNTFTWQTDYEDEGEYSVLLSVNDSNLTTSKTVSFIIIDKNRAPNSTTIPNQTWNEDTSFVMNLSDYFFDEDGNNLTYGVSDTSSGTSIILDIEGEIANFTVEENWNGEDWIIFYAYDGMYLTDSNNITLTVNPVNDEPTLKAQIPNQTWNEDNNLTLDLGDYFEDVDGDLTYTIAGNTNINLITNSTAKFVPNANWSGDEDVIINASDGVYSLSSNLFNLKVLPVNDAPVLEFIDDVNVLAGNLVNITPDASDVEGDSLDYSFTSPLNSDGEWQTNENDVGDYVTTVSVSDGNGGSDSQQVNIKVFQKVLINELVTDPDSGNDWIELYNPSDSNFNLDNCEIKDGKDNTLSLDGTISQNGFEVFEWSNRLNNAGDIAKLYCYDTLIDSATYGGWDDGNLSDNAVAPGKGESIGREPDGQDTDVDSEDFILFENPTRGLPSDTDMIIPTVQLLTPGNGETIEVREIDFFFVAFDNSDELECSLLIDSGSVDTKTIESGITDSFSYSGLSDGTYSWNVECSDSDNTASASSDRSFTISAPDNPILNLIGNKITDENKTLEFTISATDPDGDNSSFNANNLPPGADFIDNPDGTATFTWTPDYNQSGDYNVEFKVTDTTDLTDSETITITVRDAKEPPKFSDIDRCEITNSSLKIRIKNPDKGDEFKIGETIDVKVKIDNDHNEDLDVDVEVYLYDGDEEEIIDDKDDNMNIDKGKSKTFNFELEIPEDVENNDFYIFVLAEGKNGETLCNEEKVRIDVERPDNMVVI
ncbi:MAG TPA: tandem-95 repeat protein, partial [Candidatus Pacearchaeota archaeon]|nr:tandem-95 repeat protein [Candidatus Pacearchaeota archaeon]